MRYLVAFWAFPLLLFWGWYFVSLNDWNFGYVLLTREAHDLIFQVYAQLFGDWTLKLTGERVTLDPGEIPGLLARTFLFDTGLLAALVAFRRRRAIAAWARSLRARYGSRAEPAAPSA